MIPAGSQRWFVEFDGDIWENVGKGYQPDHLGDRSSAVLMQFTGLTDKNGVEIYEGDIVRSYHNNTESEIRFGIYNDSNDDGDSFENGFYFFDEEGSIADHGCGMAPDCNGKTDQYEVIGNIYQNPELLEATNA